MRAKYQHHSEEWLSGDYAAPEALRGEPSVSVWRVHVNQRDGRVALKLQPGTGVWDPEGNLLWYERRGADLSWTEGVSALLSLENKFGACEIRRAGVRHVLKRLDGDSFRQLGEMEVCVARGGVRYLILNHAQDRAAATWLDQTQWGYVLLELTTMTQTEIAYGFPTPTLSPPAFSPDDRVIVSCNYFRGAWWNDAQDDPAEVPSPGGLWKVSTIAVHDLPSNRVSYHDLLVRVPPGWIPERESGKWEMIWGPEFVSDREFKIWLPDDSVETLKLPLSSSIVVERELRRVRG